MRFDLAKDTSMTAINMAAPLTLIRVFHAMRLFKSIGKNANKTDKEMAEQVDEDDDTDPFLMDAIDVVVETGQASTSFIQRRFKVGYARAGRIIDQMEERGVISGYQGSKPREVLMTKERLAELKMATTPASATGEQTEE